MAVKMRLSYRDFRARRGFKGGRAISYAFPDIADLLSYIGAGHKLHLWEHDILVQCIETYLMPAMPVPFDYYVIVRNDTPVGIYHEKPIKENKGVFVYVTRDQLIDLIDETIPHAPSNKGFFRKMVRKHHGSAFYRERRPLARATRKAHRRKRRGSAVRNVGVQVQVAAMDGEGGPS